MMRFVLVLKCVFMLFGISSAMAQGVDPTSRPVATSRAVRSPVQVPTVLDYANAKPIPFPTTRTVPHSSVEAESRAELPEKQGVSSSWSIGNGIETPVTLGKPKLPEDAAISPREFGTSLLPFTTSRVNAFGNDTVKFYPFRAAGKLFFRIGTNTATCTASLIGPGIVVTAAHCVADYGKRIFYSGWEFVPAFNNGSGPYGKWVAEAAWVLGTYLNGTDPFQYSNDVAVLRLRKIGTGYAGNQTGWFRFGFGYSFTTEGKALISALGYPGSLDQGQLMERTDSQGETIPGHANNTLIGTLQAGGSSGGPWLVNLGQAPALSGASFGSAAIHNVVVGVTSHGVDPAATGGPVKLALASPFTRANIGVLVNAACTNAPAGAC